MTCRLNVALDERLAAYDIGPGRPLATVRVELTMELARAFSLLAERPGSQTPPLPGGTMHASTDRILITHAGGLPRPARLAAVMAARENCAHPAETAAQLPSSDPRRRLPGRTPSDRHGIDAGRRRECGDD